MTYIYFRIDFYFGILKINQIVVILKMQNISSAFHKGSK